MAPQQASYMANTTANLDLPAGVLVRGRIEPGFERILTKDALSFVAELERSFRPRVKYNMACRKEQQGRYDAGEKPGFDPATKAIREGGWVCAGTPPAITDRRVEITGPVDRKMVINALNSGAKVFMADFEDSLAPSWGNTIRGHINLRDAVNGTIQFEDKARNKLYKLNPITAVLFVRPRGWHLPEAHIEIDGEPATGCIVDFGLYFYHNHATFRAKHGGYGPFFYLPKMQHSREAAVWNSVFEKAQHLAGVPRGSIKATVLIETLPAVFQMNEILYELREHSAGLNCGRWDYIFSYVKTFRNHPDRLLPDRFLVGMTQHFMKSYAELLIQTCHRRGVHAMGGMVGCTLVMKCLLYTFACASISSYYCIFCTFSREELSHLDVHLLLRFVVTNVFSCPKCLQAAQIPIRDNEKANKAAMELVRADKLREVKAGHDGTWAAHPGLIALVTQVFDDNLPKNKPNQLDVKREDVNITEDDLIQMPRGSRTLEGLRLNTRVGIQYIAAWLSGSGSVPLYNLMEDAATAEISRVQNWQWIKFEVVLDGEAVPLKVTKQLFAKIVEEEMHRVQQEVDAEKFNQGRYKEAAYMFAKQCTAAELDDFLTLDAYRRIVEHVPSSRL